MSVDIRNSDRRRFMNEFHAREKEIASALLKVSRPSSPKALQEKEKRIRREIANSNERRRMQCINAGFFNLKSLIPQLGGDKLSKAAILQQAGEYITSLEKDRCRLQKQLDHIKGMLTEHGQDPVLVDTFLSSSPPSSKRKKPDTESSDEGVCSLSDASDDGGSDLHQENLALRNQMEVERQRCLSLEERNRDLEAQLLTLFHAHLTQAGTATELKSETLEPGQQIQLQEQINQRLSVQFVPSPDKAVASPLTTQLLSFSPVTALPDVKPGIVELSHYPVDKTTTIVMKNDIADHQERALLLSMHEMPSGMVASTVSTSSSSSSPSTITTSRDVNINSPTSTHCHRDLPQRRHRQPAQVSQLQQQKHSSPHNQQQPPHTLGTAPHSAPPKHNTQNLERLVEAIRQIEGDHVLCQQFEDDYRPSDHRVSGDECMTPGEASEVLRNIEDLKMKPDGSGQDFSHKIDTSAPTDKVNGSTNLVFCERYPSMFSQQPVSFTI